MKIGRRVYYDKTTGNVIVDKGEMEGSVVPTTIEQDIATFTVLSERSRDTFDYIELPFGEYAHDFAECKSYRVNIETKDLEFTYPDPNEPEAPPVFQNPLTKKVSDLEARQALSEEAIDFLLMNGGI